MSLAINLDDVVAVLLADGWHHVADKSFAMDSYEYVHGKDSRGDYAQVHGGGNDETVSATGFVFKEPDGSYLQGPLSAILAVRTK
jgi:hypothetical protein